MSVPAQPNQRCPTCGAYAQLRLCGACGLGKCPNCALKCESAAGDKPRTAPNRDTLPLLTRIRIPA